MKTRVFFYSAAAFMAISLVFQLHSHGQFQTDSSINYFTLTEYYDAYFDSLIQIKGPENMQGTGYKDYLRWKWFYSDRHGADGDLGAIWGGIKDYYEHYQQPENYSDLSDWRFVGPLGIPLKPNNTNSNNTGKGMMLSLWVDEGNHDLIYAGSHHSGLWKTVDGGDNWFPLHDSDPRIHGVNSIAVDPADHNIIYITALNSLAGVSSYSSGLFKSQDGGESWTGIDFSGLGISYPNAYYGHEARKVILHTNDPDIVYFVNMQNVLRSHDHGQTWQKIFSKKYFPWGGDDDTTNFDYHNGLYDLKVAPWNDSLLFLSGSEVFILQQNSGTIDTINISNSIFLAGLDQDDTLRFPPSRSGISVHENYPGKLWICHSGIYSLNGNPDTNYFRIVSYDMNSMSATLVFQHIDTYASDPGISKFKLVFSISPSDDSVFYLGGTYLFKLDLNQPQNPFHDLAYGTYPDPCWMHVDMRDMLMFSDGLGHDTLYLANDAGISWGTDFEPPQQCNANSWHWRHICSSMENGLNVTEFYGLGISDTDPYIFAGGCQDLSDMMLNQDGWVNFGEGDGSEVVFDPVSPQILYFYEWGSDGIYYRSNDFGASISIFYHGGSSYEMTPMELDPLDPSVLYSGNRSLLKFTGVNDFENPGLITPVTMANFNYGLTDIEVVEYPQNSRIFYVSTNKAYHSWDSSVPEPEDFDSCIFKSSNGTTFIDITSGLAGCLNGHITDIEANPDNPAQLWVAFGKFSKGSQDGKVFTSTDAGAHWSDCSHGLPEGLPVYKVEYLADRERLIACTDVGIFKMDAGDTIWFPFSNNLPLKIFTDLEVNEPHHKLVVSSFGRGIWETALDCPPNKYVQVITEDTLWNEDMVLDHEVAIDSNATLTIQNCRVAFPSNAKIVVKRGGHLVLDSAHLTTFCLEPWAGIELWGDDDFSQFQAQHFGRVDIKNNSIVENAVTAILTGRSDLGIPTNEYNGGIFSIKDATFRNNQTAIEVLPYTNFHPDYGFEMPYFGKIANSTFIMDATSCLGMPFEEFIKMTQVNGITIKGTDFFNEMPSQIAYPDRGKGIYSLGAHYYIDELCTNPQIQPCQDYKYCTFKGLDYGIKALGIDPIRTITVNQSIFTDNLTGIYLNGITNATITRNNFEVTSIDTTLVSVYGGLYLDYCMGYTVEENDFAKGNSAYGGTSYTFGLVVKDSGEEPNIIYNNNFTNLHVGIEALNHNRSEEISGGLVIKCNEFNTSTLNNIIVARENDSIEPAGIARYQGSNLDQSSPAGNLFYHSSMQNIWHYINNLDRYPITYYMHDPRSEARVEPLNFTESTIDTVNTFHDYDTIRSCPSHLDSIGSGSLFLTIEQAEISQDSVLSIYNEIVDGGDTEEMIYTITSSSPPDATNVYDELMANSPYLSDTVMLESIEKEDVLNSAMVTDVLVANPHSANSRQVSQALDGRSNLLNEEQRAMILQGKNLHAAKASLEAEISHYSSAKHRALNRLLGLYKNDTVNGWAFDSLQSILNNENSLSHRYQLLFTHLIENDSIGGESVLADIQSSGIMTPEDISIFNIYQGFYNYLQALRSNGRNIFNTDSLEIIAFYAQSDFTNFLPGAYVRNILQYIDTLSYIEPYILPDGQRIKSEIVQFKPESDNKAPLHYFNIYPNPANNYIFIEYKTADNHRDILLEIIDPLGNTIRKIKLDHTRNFKIISTTDFSPGFYICCLIVDGIFKESLKLTITK